MKRRDSGVPWLREIPAHWGVTRLKFVARVQTGIALGKDYGGQATSEFPYLRVANVQDGFIDLSEVKTIVVPEREAASAMLRAGDVLMNEGGDADKLGRGAIWDGSISPCLHQNHVFALRPMEVSPQWLSTWTGAEFAKAYFETRAKQATNLASISSTNLLELPIAVPSSEEQRAIVARLAHDTARIDALVAAKQRVLDLLAEKRKAIIATAVTRGLDPKVKLRDSGVPWLGEIPAHWELKRMKYLFRLVADKAPVDNDFELLSLYTDVGVKPRRELEERGNKASSTDEYWMVQPGDLVVNKLLAWMGAFGVSEYRGVTSPAYDILRPHDGVESFFYHHLFRCGVATTEVRSRSYGIMDMRLRLYFDRLGDMYVPFPPLDEQHGIVEQIARETAKLDAVRAATERTIALLKERRSALIVAAVTGQIDVGAAA